MASTASNAKKSALSHGVRPMEIDVVRLPRAVGDVGEDRDERRGHREENVKRAHLNHVVVRSCCCTFWTPGGLWALVAASVETQGRYPSDSLCIQRVKSGVIMM